MNIEPISIRQTILQAGGPSSVARALGLGQSAVSNWILRGQVPLEHVPALAKAAGVRCEQLCNDVDWDRDDSGAVTGYRVRFPTAASVEQAPSTVEPAEVGGAQ